MSSPLALLGGQPAVSHTKPHFTWPPLSERTVTAVLNQLQESISIYDRSGVIARLEDALCEYYGSAHAVLTSSGTAALYSAYAACGLRSGDEVLVPAYTFLATATPLFHLGAIPVPADCDETGNLDPKDASQRLTTKTKAIMVTHLWGFPADMAALGALADEHGLTLLEDGSHAHGAAIDGQRVGTFGKVAAFSLNGPKPLSAGEGGFIVTDDDDIFYHVLLHGHYNKRCCVELPPAHPLYPYAVTGMGLKFRIHPLAAAIAFEQLELLDSYLDQRAEIARLMCGKLSQLPGITTPKLSYDVRSSWYGLALQYRSDELEGLPVERFYEALKAEGCLEVDRPGSTCPLNLHRLFQEPAALFPEYKDILSYSPGDFPIAERVHHNTLKLPVWHREEDLPLVNSYIEAFRKVVERYRDLLIAQI